MRRSASLGVLVGLLAGCGGSGGPSFQRADGWHVLSRNGELAAANVPFAAADRSMASPPARTVAALQRDGIVIWTMYARGGNDHYPPRRLPLRVEQGVTSNPFEGFPCAPAVTTSKCYVASGSIRHLQARSGSYAIDLYVFFGTDRPTSASVAAADTELARLSV